MVDVLSRDTRRRFCERTMPENFGCIMWLGAVDRRGYGHISVGGRQLGAHRLAWMLHHGMQIPAGLTVDHLCRFPRCVNPSHLEAVTPEENSKRIGCAPDGWVPVSSHTVRRRRITEGAL